MDEKKYAELRRAALASAAGGQFFPLTTAAELVGAWDGGFYASADVISPFHAYRFSATGDVKVGGNVWQWRLNAHCRVCGSDGCGNSSISFLVPIARMPNIPGLEHGTIQEEAMHVWRTAKGQIILANADASVIQVLSKEA